VSFFSDESFWVFNGVASIAAGATAALHYDLSLGAAAGLAAGLFFLQGLFLLSRYTAWITALVNVAVMASVAVLIGWLIGDHFAPGGAVPMVVGVLFGLIAVWSGVSLFRDRIKDLRPRPERS
jgi:hypothetical protein